jgi:hypothetical protein
MTIPSPTRHGFQLAANIASVSDDELLAKIDAFNVNSPSVVTLAQVSAHELISARCYLFELASRFQKHIAAVDAIADHLTELRQSADALIERGREAEEAHAAMLERAAEVHELCDSAQGELEGVL